MLSEKLVNMHSAPLLKRKGPVPKGFFKSLVAANRGLAITEKLKERGIMTMARLAVTPVLTCANSKVTASQLVARGPMFVATTTNPVKLVEAITRESRPEDLPRPGVKLTWLKLKPAAANKDTKFNIQGKSS